MTLTVMKKSFQKYKPRLNKFRDYKYFQSNDFRGELLSDLLKSNTEISDEGFTELFETCNKHLNYHATCEQKYVRGNHLLFINKSLSTKNREKNKSIKEQRKLSIQNKELGITYKIDEKRLSQ